MRRALVILLAAHVVVGAIFLAKNLGKVPHYPDTHELQSSSALAPGYVRMARDGIMDSRRGLLYPFVLRAAHGLIGGSWEEGLKLEEPAGLPAHSIPCWAPAWQLCAQVIQLVGFLLALLYARSVLAPRSFQSRLGSATLIGAIFLDPLLLHSQLSLMPDGPAVSACLLFLSGWVEFTRTGRRRGFIALAIGALLAAGFRPEKGIVLMVASVSTAALLLFPSFSIPRVRSRILLGTSIAAMVWFGTASAGSKIQASTQAWSMGETVTHLRVVYPHLEELRPSLPEHLQQTISLKAARRFDGTCATARNVIQRLSAGDPAKRAQLTRELREVALREKGGEIFFDCVTDTLQNLIPVPSFLVRWHLWNWNGAEVNSIILRPWESIVIWGMLSYHEPQWSARALWVVSFGLLLFFVANLASLYRRKKTRARDPDAALTWVPILMLVSANAAAFAFTQDLFEVRYVYFSHLLLVALLVKGAVTQVTQSHSLASTPPELPHAHES